MDKKLLWRTCLLVVFLLVALSTPVALAASSRQMPVLDSTIAVTPSVTATPLRGFVQTPTMTPTLVGGASPIPPPPAATPLPTVTLSPPPVGGGRVAVEVLYVREEPSFGSPILSSLFYDDVVYPVQRNAEGDWVAVELAGGVGGWLWASLVFWDPALEISALPVLVGGTSSPSAETASPEAISPTLSSTATNIPTTTPSETSVPSPTTTVSPQPVATALPVLTEQPAPLVPNPFKGLPGSLKLGLLIGGGVILMSFVAYIWRRSAGRREIRRYDGGFLLDTCPACHEGRLQLDEVIHRSIGIPSVRRSVRCSACRSVLREIRPGRWRYTVDPFANPDMASRYKNRRLSMSDLEALKRESVAAQALRSAEEETPFAEQIDTSFLDVIDEEVEKEPIDEPDEVDISGEKPLPSEPPGET
ncbi:MAG: hypothetical protein JXB30_11905 [Anaerolineae bacterium]|nr:hypothetical protein [Anaerolineae bacterium]